MPNYSLKVLARTDRKFRQMLASSPGPHMAVLEHDGKDPEALKKALGDVGFKIISNQSGPPDVKVGESLALMSHRMPQQVSLKGSSEEIMQAIAIDGVQCVYENSIVGYASGEGRGRR